MTKKGKHVESYKDCFGRTVNLGDTIIFYSGNTAQFEEGKVKLIYSKEDYYHDCRITLESGSVINATRMTMRKPKDMS